MTKIAVLLVLLLPGAACGPADAAGAQHTLTVLAAASLTGPFTAIGADFEAAHPGVRVEFSFAGSAQLAQQIRAGAPADLFAAADHATMRVVADGGDASGAARVFAHNRLVIAVPNGNPRGIATLGDLDAAGTTVALCAPQVPCGAAARRALDTAGVELTPVTWEQDVRATLAKVRLGEVDAALVYRTEALAAADEIDVVEFPESAATVNDYPIAVLAEARHPAEAEAFVAYLLSEPGRKALTEAGFQTP